MCQQKDYHFSLDTINDKALPWDSTSFEPLSVHTLTSLPYYEIIQWKSVSCPHTIHLDGAPRAIGSLWHSFGDPSSMLGTFCNNFFVPNMVGISYSKPWVDCTLDEDLEAYVWFRAKYDTVVFVCVRFVLVLTRYSLFHPIIN